MSDAQQMTGHCLCGAVTYKTEIEDRELGVCHCSMCRRWAGGPFFVLTAKRGIEFHGAEHVGVFRSSDYGERGFCKACGTTLFWRMQDGSHTVISAMTADDLSAVKLSHEIFIDEKPEFYSFSQDTKKMTGAEVFAAFAGGDSGHDDKGKGD